MASQHVLREYLISLGFRVNAADERKYTEFTKKTSAGVHILGRSIAGAAVAAQALVATWARSMEQLYFSTRKAESAAGNLKALDYAARSIGLGSGQMTAAIEGMARAMRLNPGLQGLVESFGIKVTGRDKADVAVDMVDALRKLPFYVGSQYAGLFGIDPDTFLLLSEGVDKMRAMAQSRKEMAEAAGLDTEAAMMAAKEYSEQLREIQELFGILKDTAALAMLPVFKEVAGVTKEVLKDWTKIFKERSLDDFKDALDYAITGKVKKDGMSWWDRFLTWGGAKGAKKPNDPYKTPAAATGSAGSEYGAVQDDPASLFNAIETKYGIPLGLLDKMWAKESARGKNMLSPKGARGHFQFMPGTAKQYGVTNPDDLAQSADGAARYMRNLLEKYDGDDRLALAAYNWGQGNLDKYGVTRAPKETRDYVQTISGRPLVIQQETTVHVAGASDPDATARAVAGEQRGVNADLASTVRNHIGAVQ